MALVRPTQCQKRKTPENVKPRKWLATLARWTYAVPASTPIYSIEFNFLFYKMWRVAVLLRGSMELSAENWVLTFSTTIHNFTNFFCLIPRKIIDRVSVRREMLLTRFCLLEHFNNNYCKDCQTTSINNCVWSLLTNFIDEFRCTIFGKKC